MFESCKDVCLRNRQVSVHGFHRVHYIVSIKLSSICQFCLLATHDTICMYIPYLKKEPLNLGKLFKA